MKRIITVLAMICLLSTNKALHAQVEFQAEHKKQKQIEPDIPKPYSVHELSAYVTAGMTNIVYKLADGTRDGGFGAGVGFNYAYNINGSIAIVSGLEFAVYNSVLNMDNCSAEYMDVDDMGEAFIFNYDIAGYSEKQSAYLLSVPLMARFSTPADGWTKYYVAGGFKLGIPVSAKASISPTTVTTSGHYDFEGGAYTDLPQYGFINGQEGEQTDGNIKLNVAALLAIETGVRFQIGYKKNLITGVYLDYSLNNIQKAGNRHVLEYQPLNPSMFEYNSVINTATVNKVNLFSFGVKVGLNF